MNGIAKYLIISICTITMFVMLMISICLVDVQAIGPQGSSVGFASLNNYVHNLTGVHLGLYNITDWLGFVPIFICIGFSILGLIQWIRRRSIRKVDCSILILGMFYIITILLFGFFEIFVVNYRPVLINGSLEASYPSSTTLLTTCVMPTALMQFNNRIKSKMLRNFLSVIIIVFVAFMVIGRLVSGVHWFTDIVGGALISTGLVMMYRAFINKFHEL